MLAALQALPVLNAPFTLTYRMTTTDIRSKAAKDAALAAVKQDMAERVEDGSLSADAAEKAVAAFAKSRDAPPTKATLTLSYDGRTLLIDQEMAVTLLSSGGTFRFVKGPTDGVRGVWSFGIEPGETPLPFVGASFPLLSAPKLNLTRDARKAVVRAAALDDVTILSAHVPLRGLLVGRWIVRTTKETRTEYSLVSQLASALPVDRFRPDHYVSSGDEIALPNRPNLVFDPQKGDLTSQVKTITSS